MTVITSSTAPIDEPARSRSRAMRARMSFAAFAGFDRQGLHLAGHDGEAASGGACPRRFDRGVERKQIGLPRHRGDGVDDADDLLRRLDKLRDERIGAARAVDGLSQPGVGLVHRKGDLSGGRREFLGRGGKGDGLGGGAFSRLDERIHARVNLAKVVLRRRNLARRGADRLRHMADGPGKIGFEAVDDLRIDRGRGF